MIPQDIKKMTDDELIREFERVRKMMNLAAFNNSLMRGRYQARYGFCKGEIERRGLIEQ